MLRMINEILMYNLFGVFFQRQKRISSTLFSNYSKLKKVSNCKSIEFFSKFSLECKKTWNFIFITHHWFHWEKWLTRQCQQTAIYRREKAAIEKIFNWLHLHPHSHTVRSGALASCFNVSSDGRYFDFSLIHCLIF